MSEFEWQSAIQAPAEAVYDYYARPSALERLTPPWERFELLEESGGIEPGGRKVMRTYVGPFPMRWVARHGEQTPGRRFEDVQLDGPFRRWLHRHDFEPIDDERSRLLDRIDYQLPFGAVGRAAAGRQVRGRLERMFRYRHEITRWDVPAHQRQTERGPLRILISGASGLLGSALTAFLNTGGHQVLELTRQAGDEDSVHWSPREGEIDGPRLEGLDAVVHLAGESIIGRWNADKKQRVRESRRQGTRLLAESLAKLAQPPKVMVSASAVGYYGSRGEEPLTEEAAPGDDFLAEVCREWEDATAPAAEAGIRLVQARFGMILTPAGGALGQMLTPFQLGVGGRLGDGRQRMSWIAIDDAIGAIHHALFTEGLTGPMNVVAPTPVANLEFTRTLARVLHRPAMLPAPAPALRMVFGEMADALLLASQQALPARLEETGYVFRYPDLEPALRHLLGRVE